MASSDGKVPLVPRTNEENKRYIESLGLNVQDNRELLQRHGLTIPPGATDDAIEKSAQVLREQLYAAHAMLQMASSGGKSKRKRSKRKTKRNSRR